MWSVKASEIEIAAIISVVFIVIAALFFYAFIFNPFVEGPLKAIEADNYCVEEFEVSGYLEPHLILNLSQIYYPEFLELYITPGGYTTLGIITPEIRVIVFDEFGYPTYLGKITNLEGNDIGAEIPCMGSRTSMWSDKDQCETYKNNPITMIYAEAEQTQGGCLAYGSALKTVPGLNLIHVFSGLDDGTEYSICNVDKIRARIYYKCKNGATLINGTNSSGQTIIGWDYKYPLDTQVAPLITNNCPIANGKYSTSDVDIIKQMLFTGTPLVRVGARAGCAGVQTPCDIEFSFAKPNNTNGCIPGLSWSSGASGTRTITDLDYEYIYSDPISISQYVNINQSSPFYKKWCMKVENNNGCLVNSIDVQKFVK